MSREIENIPITMIRADLENIPYYALPAGYAIRWYKPGDAETWVRIQQEADKYNEITLPLFECQFGSSLPVLRDRLCFLCDADGTAIGTAAAWFDDNYNNQRYGRVHWVAIVSQMQGRGLSKPMMTTVLNRLRDLGHSRAYLTTATMRIPAIRLYLKFGFLPEIKNERDAGAWQQVRKQIGDHAIRKSW